MKKILLSTLAFCFFANVFAQNNLDRYRSEITESINELAELRNERISSFLSQNPNLSKVFVENTVTYVMYDVIDNKPIYRTLDNTDAAEVTRTNELQIGGTLGLDLDGTGITVAVWDGGPIQLDHVEFQDATNSASRAINIDSQNTEGTFSQDDHGTHVSGTISAKGVNPSAKGMATNVNLKTYNFNNDTPEINAEQANTNSDIFLSNHSYGIPINQGNGNTLPAWQMGAYTAGARQIDEIAYAYPQYLIVMSAGNSGNTTYTGGLFGNNDKLTGDKNAKNNLVVANSNPSINAFTQQLNIVINSGSSQGPTDDLRIKPDIAGDGTNLFSPTTGSTYSTFSGTSMASPNVTGSLVLLQQYYEQLNGGYMRSATLKGLVCHTAQDDNTISGPDHVHGWGLLNSRDAANTITDANNGLALINEDKLLNGGEYTFTFSATAGDVVSATLCWTDVAGNSVSGEANLNNQTPRLVNDLDIRISNGTDTFLPWRLNYSPSTGFSNSKADNIRDNVERIDIDAIPTTGVYTITVSHKGSLSGPTPFDSQEQNFSLILTGNNLSLSNSDFNLAENSFNIYPNPNNGVFNIQYKSANSNNIDLEIYDISGRLVYNKTYSDANTISKSEINLKDFNTGVYLIKLIDGDITSTKKLVLD